MIGPKEIETIILLSDLTGMSLVDACYAVLPDFDRTNFEQTAALTIAIMSYKKSLDTEFKDAHS